MQQDSYLLRSFKFGIIIFIPLAIIISLFPPFNWDIPSNRKVHHYNAIKDLLPLKKYSLIFDFNKKPFIFGEYKIVDKYYNCDSLKVKDILSDAINFNIVETGIDSFYSLRGFAYKLDKKYVVTGRRFVRFLKEAGIKKAINYSEIKNEYLQNPDIWDVTSYQNSFDSSKAFSLYDIVKPHYYLLERELLFSELFVNYLLAFFVTIGIGLLFVKIKERRRS